MTERRERVQNWYQAENLVYDFPIGTGLKFDQAGGSYQWYIKFGDDDWRREDGGRPVDASQVVAWVRGTPFWVDDCDSFIELLREVTNVGSGIRADA